MFRKVERSFTRQTVQRVEHLIIILLGPFGLGTECGKTSSSYSDSWIPGTHSLLYARRGRFSMYSLSPHECTITDRVNRFQDHTDYICVWLHQLNDTF
jgi:hypothetical protein